MKIDVTSENGTQKPKNTSVRGSTNNFRRDNIAGSHCIHIFNEQFWIKKSGIGVYGQDIYI
jgi:hypothetical protein